MLGADADHSFGQDQTMPFIIVKDFLVASSKFCGVRGATAFPAGSEVRELGPPLAKTSGLEVAPRRRRGKGRRRTETVPPFEEESIGPAYRTVLASLESFSIVS